MSRTSEKSSKQLNASLERIHTFGMSNIHKGKYDVEKIDNQYEAEQKKKSLKKIQKAPSSINLKKLKNAINNNLNDDEDGSKQGLK